MVNLTINGKAVSVKEGTTILEAAKTIGETIPTLCYLKEVNAIGACRVCVVEVEGTDRCVTACNNFVEEGMVVYTNSRKGAQRVAEVRHFHPQPLCLQLLDGVQILDVGGHHAIRQRGQHVPRPLCQIAGVHHPLDEFDGHSFFPF